MVLGETCKIAAASADRRKVAALGAGCTDWVCIGTSLDALGLRGRVTAPGPDLFRTWYLAPCAVSFGDGSLGVCAVADDDAMEPNGRGVSGGPHVGHSSTACRPGSSACRDRGLRCGEIVRL